MWGAISGTLDLVPGNDTTEEILPKLNDIAGGHGDNNDVGSGGES